MASSRTDAHRALRAAVAGLPDVTPKRMFGAEAFFTRHGMFAFLLDDAIVLKLPEAERAEVLSSRVGRPFLTSEKAPFGRWVEIGLPSSEAGSRALVLARSAHALAQAPDREGPRRRKPVTRRRKAAKRVSS
ncbi:MAG TPA: TfoX/Sxy family protein [Gemmatimonadales bacterium]|nr:TfoX/Sxy family protein [Gemmatimonadales bacterium]